jgi:uncharacterized protein (TIGR03790 family)
MNPQWRRSGTARRWLGSVAFCWLVGLGGSCCAGGTAENLALVVNPNDADSLAVANAYIQLRGVPASNVVYIPWKPNVRQAKGVEFRDRLLKPLLAELDSRGLTPQIDCVAYSSGFPYVVDFSGDFAGAALAPQATPMASLTGATYLYRLAQERSPQLTALDSNGYYAAATSGEAASIGFSSQSAWSAGNRRDAGGRYLLATALGVTFGRGNTVDEILACLRRAKEADGARPSGTVYYMQNDNVRSQVRHASFPAAVAELTALGVKAQVLRGVAPTGKKDVAGLTTGTSHLQLRSANCRLLPGALVDNLTSAAGQFQVGARVANPQTPVSEFLRLGAAGASGTVVEPFAIAEKFPSASLHVHYARGLTLAEAFYRSVAGPYQLIIVGDPLCQPWAALPRISVDGLPTGSGVLTGQTTLKPQAAYPDGRHASRFEVYIDGRLETQAPAGRDLMLDTTKLADGFHDLRIVAVDDTPVSGKGSWGVPAQVKNGRDSLQLLAAQHRVAAGDSLTVTAAATTSRPTVILHNGRRMGVVQGANGRVTIDAAKLGKGPVTLHGIQEQGGKVVLRSRPVTIEVY